MVIEAWQSALDIDVYMARDLVHIPSNPVYRLNVNGDDFSKVRSALSYRLSYFAKTDTKRRGQRSRNFGTSRIR